EDLDGEIKSERDGQVFAIGTVGQTLRPKSSQLERSQLPAIGGIPFFQHALMADRCEPFSPWMQSQSGGGDWLSREGLQEGARLGVPDPQRVIAAFRVEEPAAPSW